jgi:hypothetical protein
MQNSMNSIKQDNNIHTKHSEAISETDRTEGYPWKDDLYGYRHFSIPTRQISRDEIVLTRQHTMRVKVDVYLLSCSTSDVVDTSRDIDGPFQFLDVTQQWDNGFKLDFILDFASRNLIAKCTKSNMFGLQVTAYKTAGSRNRCVIYTFATVDYNWRNGSESVTYTPIGLSAPITKPKTSTTRDFINDWGNRLLPHPKKLPVHFFTPLISNGFSYAFVMGTLDAQVSQLPEE